MFDNIKIRTKDMPPEMRILLDEQQTHGVAGKLHGVAETIEAFLERHLSDEEELAVPIILHHRLRG